MNVCIIVVIYPAQEYLLYTYIQCTYMCTNTKPITPINVYNLIKAPNNIEGIRSRCRIVI